MAVMEIGARYGRWTVLDTAHAAGEGPKNRTVAAICDCGTEKRVYRHKLRSGQSQSCGCHKGRRGDTLRGKQWPNLAPDIADEIIPGARFGRWTALTLPYSEPGKRNRIAQARCDCGTQRTVVAAFLLNGKSKSCGCLRRDGARAAHAQP